MQFNFFRIHHAYPGKGVGDMFIANKSSLKNNSQTSKTSAYTEFTQKGLKINKLYFQVFTKCECTKRQAGKALLKHSCSPN